jgi:hypothetical protein
MLECLVLSALLPGFFIYAGTELKSFDIAIALLGKFKIGFPDVVYAG